eukprot:TRINITY_DN12448_c0_g1_i1.p2 TRINITY_DN12448_c0_g1~~TRINITY_DN12448_c0_g1_i1.p2  ORF type:complete len:753 (+),score=192.08 TRINITY_DN12448_c0_g1_i1:3023-5281(+)
MTLKSGASRARTSASRGTTDNFYSRLNTGAGLRSRRQSTLASAVSTRQPKEALKLLDDNGNDITPKRLVASDVVICDYHLPPADTTELPFSLEYESDSEGPSRAATAASSAIGSNSRSQLTSAYSYTSVAPKAPSIRERPETPPSQGKVDLSDKELVQPVHLVIEETETMFLLDIAPTWIDPESPLADTVQKQNEDYQALLERKQNAPDAFGERFAQTNLLQLKTKAAQAVTVTSSEAGTQASGADIHDTMLTSQGVSKRAWKGMDKLLQKLDPNKAQVKASSSNLEVKDDLGFGLISIDGAKDNTVPAATWTEAVTSPTLLSQLHAIERALQQDAAREARSKFHYGMAISSMDKFKTNELWRFEADGLEQHRVSACCWNKTNPNIVAIGYTSKDTSGNTVGAVCCFSYKNTKHPQRRMRLPSGVSAMDFSQEHPHLLVVGTQSGDVFLYDIFEDCQEALADTLSIAVDRKHVQPVWQLQFVSLKGKLGADERVEMLVSASTDGKLFQWSVYRGLESSLLMQVKRVAPKSKAHRGNSNTAFLARQAGVLAFDFNPKMANVYLIATEDGNVHRCSSTYPDSYLESYYAHTAPIHQIQYSPFDADLFVTCSADWRLIVWSESHPELPYLLHPSNDPVLDVAWSHHKASILASISDETLYVWDLLERDQDPIYTIKPAGDGVKLTSVMFHPLKHAIAVGTSTGHVILHQLPDAKEDQDLAIRDLRVTLKLDGAHRPVTASKPDSGPEEQPQQAQA